jgi:hypothetical protein
MRLIAKIIEQEYHKQNADNVNNNVFIVIHFAVAANVVNIIQRKYAIEWPPKKIINGAQAVNKPVLNRQYNTVG